MISQKKSLTMTRIQNIGFHNWQEQSWNRQAKNGLIKDLLAQETVGWLYIATGQYSSLCVSAVVFLTLGGDDIVEVDVQVRELTSHVIFLLHSARV